MLQDDDILKAMTGAVEPEVLNKVMIPKFIQNKYPDLTEEQNDELRDHIIADSLIKNAKTRKDEHGNTKFIQMANQFYNVDDLHIDLIHSINPFQKAYEVLSKNINNKLLKVIGNAIETNRIAMTDGEAYELFVNAIPKFINEHKREPDIHSINEREKRMAEAIIYLRKKKREYLQKKDYK